MSGERKMGTSSVCPTCERQIKHNQHSVECSSCLSWIHKGCTGISTEEFEKMCSKAKKNGTHNWECKSCKKSVVRRLSAIGSGCDSSEGSTMQRQSHERQKHEHDPSANKITDLPAISLETLEIETLINKKNVNVKDAVLIISQLYKIITAQNANIQLILAELKSAQEDKLKITHLESEITVLKENIMKLKNSDGQIGHSTTQSAGKPDQVLSEIIDRKAREKNILIYKIPESSSSDTNIRISHDVAIVKEALEAIDVQETEFRCFRIGRRNVHNSEPRPLKVSFQNQESALLCLRNKRKLLEGSSSYRIGADLTVTQRKQIKDLHAELSRRKNNGEENIYIKYVQGVPSIVKAKQSKNEER